MDVYKRIIENAPCYVYDSKAIIQNCRKLTSSLPWVQFLYSIKANPFDSVVQLIGKEGFGADVSSAAEVCRALTNGIPPERIFFSAPGKTGKDIREVYGKCTFIADSFHELELLEQAAIEHGETAFVGLRINPRSAFAEKEASSKFGIDEEQVLSGETILPRLAHVKIIGIHIHVKSQVLSADQLERYYERCFDTAERVSRIPGVELRFINFGSGIGMVYDPEVQSEVPLERLAECFRRLQGRNRTFLNAAFYIETGRYVVGHAGKYYTPVVDIKESGGTKYLIVRNAMNGFFRPVMAQILLNAVGEYPKQGMEPVYTCEKEVAVQVMNDSGEKEKVTVVGNLCTAQDVICRDVYLNKARIGDLVEITNAGSYGYSLSPLLFADNEVPKQLLI